MVCLLPPVSSRNNWLGEGILRSCEKINLVLFAVIPAKAGIQCFHSITN
jgi:hypothetical protein